MIDPSTNQPGPETGGDGGDTEPDDTEPDDGGNSGASPVNLSSMTKAQLLSYAEENGISGVDGDLKKADIIAKITEASNA